MSGNIPTPEFSHLLPLERIGGQGCRRHITADTRERAALARRFDLLALDRLEAELVIKPKGHRLILVEGECEAEVTQSCVVSLQPIRQELRFGFQQAFTATPTAAAARHELVIEVEDEDPAEEIGPGGLDLGEVVAQQLAVNLDPYPRASDAELAGLRDRLEDDAAEAAEPQAPSVFAALRDLKVVK